MNAIKQCDFTFIMLTIALLSEATTTRRFTLCLLLKYFSFKGKSSGLYICQSGVHIVHTHLKTYLDVIFSSVTLIVDQLC